MSKKIKSILEYAMRMERDAKEFYSYHLDNVSSPELKKVLEELVEMEESHYEALLTMKDRLNIDPLPVSISWVVDDVAKEVNPSIIADNSELIANPEAINDLSIVRLAYLMERDFELFYKNAANAVEDQNAKDFLLELSKWEAQHKQIFKTRYEGMLKEQWSELTQIIFE
jgi:rubrerythrin